MATPWLENDGLFREKLEVGRRGEIAVATALMLQGVPVELTPLKIRDNVADRGQFLQQADIWAGPWRSPYRIEAKHIKTEFTGVSDYPFKMVTVMSQHKYDAQVIHPLAIVLVSQVTGAMIVASCGDDEQWGVERVSDRERGYDLNVYQCPLHLMRDFKELSQWLLQRHQQSGQNPQ